jgi:hypothetical protein
MYFCIIVHNEDITLSSRETTAGLKNQDDKWTRNLQWATWDTWSSDKGQGYSTTCTPLFPSLPCPGDRLLLRKHKILLGCTRERTSTIESKNIVGIIEWKLAIPWRTLRRWFSHAHRRGPTGGKVARWKELLSECPQRKWKADTTI